VTEIFCEEETGLIDADLRRWARIKKAELTETGTRVLGGVQLWSGCFEPVLGEDEEFVEVDDAVGGEVGGDVEGGIVLLPV